MTHKEINARSKERINAMHNEGRQGTQQQETKQYRHTVIQRHTDIQKENNTEGETMKHNKGMHPVIET